MYSWRKTAGFTLIEILVVVAIIGILTAVLLANMAGARQRAADASLKNGVKQFKTALRLYYNDNQTYPANCSGLCEAGDSFTGGGTQTYMSVVPEYDYYLQTNSGDGFVVGIELSNASDADIARSQSECGYSGTANPLLYVVCAE